MKTLPEISTSRLEAFSDGVIAIIITVMVFDLKFAEAPTSETVWASFGELLPRFASYAVSFLMLAIMWVSHHQLFHTIRRVDNRLLWLNINLLFWMSLIPFGTHMIGGSPFLWQSCVTYALVFMLNSFSFMLIRSYTVKGDLLHGIVDTKAHLAVNHINYASIILFVIAGGISLLSPYLSFAIFLIIPCMYLWATLRFGKTQHESN
jgi:uncharacterized membrane protein